MPTQSAAPSRIRTPSDTPTPIPAWAAVLSPELEVLSWLISVSVGTQLLVLLEVITDDVVVDDDDAEDVDESVEDHAGSPLSDRTTTPNAYTTFPAVYVFEVVEVVPEVVNTSMMNTLSARRVDPQA